jgi:hypothetical protein
VGRYDGMMKRDPIAEAARLVRKATAGADEPLPPDLEAAWEAWRKGVQQVDERVSTLLRAAFEAGADAARSLAASSFARSGGLRGGKARAAKLSAAKRKAIAKRAAKKRWSLKSGGSH